MSKRAILLLALFQAALSISVSAAEPANSTPPAAHKGPLTVAFVVTANANVMDFAGPWEVFQDVSVPNPGPDMKDRAPFDLFTVSDSKDPVTMTGGLQVVAEHTFADAPTPDIVVVGAQKGSDAMIAWLRKVSSKADVVSVCTGAFKLAKAGLLDGHPATTHHDFFDRLAKDFPKVQVQRGLRWVQSTDTIYTAGGLTSGIDLALHIVAKYYGDDAASRTAEYMEHAGDGWKDPKSTPVRQAAR